MKNHLKHAKTIKTLLETLQSSNSVSWKTCDIGVVKSLLTLGLKLENAVYHKSDTFSRSVHEVSTKFRRLKRVSGAKTSTCCCFRGKIGELALSLFVPSSARSKIILAFSVV